MNVEFVFPVPLVHEFVEIDNDAIEKYCYKLRDEVPKKDRMADSWQSAWLDLDDTTLAPLVNHVQQKMDETSANLYKFTTDYTISLKNYWININEPNGQSVSNNLPHMHGHYFFSMVYYVKCDKDSGQLHLVPPHGHLDYTIPHQLVTEFNVFNSQRWNVSAEVGKLIGFPSWLNHYADNTNSTDRISIAFSGMLERRM